MEYIRSSVIYVDLPWPYQTYSDRGKDRSAEQHYDTLDLSKIDAVTPLIWDLAAPNCALFLWTTWAHLLPSKRIPAKTTAGNVIGACGFEYSTTAFVWAKTESDVTVDRPPQLQMFGAMRSDYIADPGGGELA
jgi:N6-adenosine-specific RNA methylase IME4